MTWNPITSTDRREAIGRASRAVVRLAIDPEATLPARRQKRDCQRVQCLHRPRGVGAVAALEDMVFARGLVTPQQVVAERRAAAVAVLMGEDG